MVSNGVCLAVNDTKIVGGLAYGAIRVPPYIGKDTFVRQRLMLLRVRPAEDAGEDAGSDKPEHAANLS